MNEDPKESGLIPVGNKALTTRSSALVKRGLEALALQRGRIVRFPADRSIGTFQLWDPQNNSTQADEDACGDVIVPPGMKLDLFISPNAICDLSPLALVGPDDLHSLLFLCSRHGVYLEDCDLAHITHLRSLEALWLCGNGYDHISDVGLRHIGKLTALTSLFLNTPNITDGGLICLQNLNQLENLWLSGCQLVTNSGLSHIVTLQTLRHLSLQGSLISDSGLVHLQKLKNLDSLNISKTKVSDSAISTLRAALPSCRIINDSPRLQDSDKK